MSVILDFISQKSTADMSKELFDLWKQTIESNCPLIESVNIHSDGIEFLTEKSHIITGTLESCAVNLRELVSEALDADGSESAVRIGISGHFMSTQLVLFREVFWSLNLAFPGIRFISCPTCGRTSKQLIPLAEKLYQKTRLYCFNSAIKSVALMGCAVNGPGEAREVDLAFCLRDKGTAALFFKGEYQEEIPLEEILSRFESCLSINEVKT